jgi:hypothetical protein
MSYLYLINNPKEPKSFGAVWITLMEVAQMLPIQAEQCCLIAMDKGKCQIKTGDFLELHKLQLKLEEKKLTIKLTHTPLP